MAAAVGRKAPPERGLAPDDDLPAEYWQTLMDDPRADAVQPGSGASGRPQRLGQIPKHLLRVGCRRCGRILEIQRVDAIRLYGPDAVWKDVGQRRWTTPARSGPGAMRKTAAGRRTTCRRPPADGPKASPDPLSGGDRKALQKELNRASAMTMILTAQAAEVRAKGEAFIKQADRLLCESWNERMWADGEPIDPSPTVDQAVNGG